jgi:hypothetical protein
MFYRLSHFVKNLLYYNNFVYNIDYHIKKSSHFSLFTDKKESLMMEVYCQEVEEKTTNPKLKVIFISWIGNKTNKTMLAKEHTEGFTIKQIAADCLEDVDLRGGFFKI